MIEFRKKQLRLKRVMNFTVIFAALYIFIYIGVAPYIDDTLASTICRYFCDIIVVVSLVIIFIYTSKYSKSDTFLSLIEKEISDAGYYLTSRPENNSASYTDSMYDDLKNCGFSLNKKMSVDDFEFAVRGFKRQEYFYIADIDDCDRNDVLAYLDAVINDLTVKNIKRKGDAVLCIVTDKAQESAIALSKMITPLGKKEKLKIAICIVEISTGYVYFLGNNEGRCKKLIANFVMNCEIPIDDNYIGKEKLAFQYELEEKMKSFNIKDFNKGNFYIH